MSNSDKQVKVKNFPEKETKIFYAYTPQDFKKVFTVDTRKDGIAENVIPYGERATIAVRYKDGYVNYGVSLCDENDHFDKAEGRRIAKERLENSFAVIDVRGLNYEGRNLDEIVIGVLNKITESVYRRFGKYNVRIQKYNRLRNLTKNTEVAVEQKPDLKQVSSERNWAQG